MKICGFLAAMIPIAAQPLLAFSQQLQVFLCRRLGFQSARDCGIGLALLSSVHRMDIEPDESR
jgi:hypothetical protein